MSVGAAAFAARQEVHEVIAMKLRRVRRGSIVIVALALAAAAVAAPATAQSIGVSGGLAIPSAEIAQLPQDVRDAGWTEVASRAERGYFIEVRGRLGSGLALTGAVSYNRFLDAVSEYGDGSGHTVTLVSAQSIVPISLGVERTFGQGFIVPFGTLEATLSYLYRSYESPQNGTPVPFSMQSSGDARYGAAVGIGSALDLAVLRLDAYLRLQFVNLFGSSSTTESTMYYLQAGFSGYFGL
jgi:hypothetical protein